MSALSTPKLASVIGWPITHSLSPLMHNHWLAEHKILGNYIPLAVRAEDFGACVAALKRMRFAGINVTLPHKEAAFALASTLDDDARAAGSVNTLSFAGETIHGFNLDGRGFAASLEESLGPAAARAGPVVVLGAGGAARAIVLAFLKAGAAEIRLVNRTQTRGQALASSFPHAPIRLFPWGAKETALVGAGLLVNASSLGMTGAPALDISLDALPRSAAVADIVYNPLKTGLLRAARARGHRTMDGLGMLMHQGALAFALFFGMTPKVTPELRVLLERALRG